MKDLSPQSVQAKLGKIRQSMKNVGADFYYVPSSDPHQSEYVPKLWQRRQWVSDFTGSAGDVLISHDSAYLWTDGRYAIQAKNELDLTEYKYFITGSAQAINISNWLNEYAKNKVVAIDPKLISIDKAAELKRVLAHIDGKLVPFIENFVDMAKESPESLPEAPMVLYDQHYSGETTASKLKRLRLAMSRANCDTHIINLLDSIAWLFNIRGEDVLYSPVVISYAIITQNTATLYVDLNKVDDDIQKALQVDVITIKDYDTFGADLSNINGTVMIDRYTASWWIERQLAQAKLHFQRSPVTLFKAQKNSVELNGTKEAHRRDGVAVIRFLHWLESTWQQGVDELDAAKKIAQFRQENDHFKGLSFGTISSFAENSAIMHYQVTKKTNKKIDDSSIYLVDSGGQYLDGTTDITRTVHLGKPTSEQQKHYTLVLKGHLALKNAVFINGTKGEHLDALARQYLWRAGLNFAHGTGHGVGHYLCVHEGPQSISFGATGQALMPGMVVSNEPGVYFADHYGIRIENVCAITEAKIPSDTFNNPHDFYTIEDLTVVPYAKNLIDINLLTQEEIKSINQYHTLVLRRVVDLLPKEAKAWLEKATDPLITQ